MSQSNVSQKSRYYYIDWLRALTMLLVFSYHSNRFFDAGGWHIKNAELSVGSTIFENVLGVFIMPMLFVLSGMSVFYSLKYRTAGQFCKERLLRLGVPFVVFGIFIFGPVQIYLERFTHGSFTSSFWDFIPHYFEGFYGFGGNFAWVGVHLWYLLILLFFSLVFLPLLMPSKSAKPNFLTQIAPFFVKPWALLLLFIPLILASLLTDTLGMGFTRQMGGWDLFSYMLFFLYGYLIVADSRIIGTIKKYSLLTGIMAVVLAVAALLFIYAGLTSADIAMIFASIVRTIISWFAILSFLGAGSYWLTMNNKFLHYANDAVLPFYILHQPVILSVGFFVVQWNLPIIAKYFIIVCISFTVIMTVYELLVRRIGFLRFLFGMKEKKKELPANPV
jgi:glucans biosynthesis protein C